MKKETGKTFVIGLVVVLFVMAIIGGGALFVFNDKDYEVTVTRVERVVTSSTSSEGGSTIDSKYLIYCETNDGEVIVFENTDEWIRGKFNSSDFYAQIKEGQRYIFTVVGYRIPIFDSYQNIIKIQKL